MGAKKNKYYDDDDILPDEDSPDKAAGMVLWTKRTAFFMGFCAFVAMFLMSFDFTAYDDITMIVIAIIKGFGAALLLWMAGLIIGNIFIKGLVTDVPVDQDHLVEGGLLQRIYLYQQRLNYDKDGNVILIDPSTDTVVKGNAKTGAAAKKKDAVT